MSRRKSFAIMTDSRISRNFSHASLSPPTVSDFFSSDEVLSPDIAGTPYAELQKE